MCSENLRVKLILFMSSTRHLGINCSVIGLKSGQKMISPSFLTLTIETCKKNIRRKPHVRYGAAYCLEDKSFQYFELLIVVEDVVQIGQKEKNSKPSLIICRPFPDIIWFYFRRNYLHFHARPSHAQKKKLLVSQECSNKLFLALKVP